MHALIVIAHPINTSLSHQVATQIAKGIALSDPGHRVEIADLVAEGFDPRFNVADVATFHKEAAPPADVAAEQARIDRTDALVLVYPIYWWSMPGLLKGWIDRVFSNGWAYDEGADGKPEKKLHRLQVHLVAIGAADRQTYTRYGFAEAMKAQIEHGIFDYCGAPVATSVLLLQPELQELHAYRDAAYAIGHKIFAASMAKAI